MGLVVGAALPVRKADAADGDNLVLGQLNNAESDTSLQGTLAGGSSLRVANRAGARSVAIHGEGPNGATGVLATSSRGLGLHAMSEATGALGEGGVEGVRAGVGVHGIGRGIGKEIEGIGVLGHGQGPFGVGGEFTSDSEGGTGAKGEAFGEGSIGVYGHGELLGIRGHSFEGAGVEGLSEGGPGVHGIGEAAYGVLGFGALGGVRGMADLDSPGVLAESRRPETGIDNGLALRVLGQAEFSNAGEGVIPAFRSSSGPVTPPNGLPAVCNVLVTLTSDPGYFNFVRWIEIARGHFTVHLTARTPRDVTFRYLVIQIPEPGGVQRLDGLP